NIHAYVIVILGGMGSVFGSIIAGILLGESENLFTAFFPDPTRALAYTNAFGLLVLMIVLTLRPQGLFGRRHLRMEYGRVRGLHTYILLAVIVLALAHAPNLNPYWMHVAIIAMFYGILAASWSLLAGYAGLFSLGHMAFASIGGYTSGLLVKWYGIPIPV